MTKYLVALIAIVMLVVPAAGAGAKDLKTDMDKSSYAIGLRMGGNLLENQVEVDLDAFIQGFNDGRKGAKPALTEEEIQAAMNKLTQDIMARRRAAFQKKADDNLAAGKKFLEENKKKEGVKTTSSGLQYKVVRPGKGPKPKATDTVTVHYRGKNLKGEEFDSSYSRGQPATFAVNGVIAGWQEALQLMKEGAKYEIVIPADLAYGVRGAGQKIGPNEVLVFDVELLKVGRPDDDKKDDKKDEQAKPDEKKKK